MFVALMLVVQALLSGLSLGAAAAQPYDALGRIICATDGAARTAPDQPADPTHHILDCCTLGCSMVGATVPPAIDGVWSHPRPARETGTVIVRNDAPTDAPERAPQNPRAPPGLI